LIASVPSTCDPGHVAHQALGGYGVARSGAPLGRGRPALAAGCAAAFVARPGMHLSRFERPDIVGDDLIAVARQLSA
jgi:hypothetical protein